MKADYQTHKIEQPVYVDVPTDKFRVFFGYKDRCSVQVRLQKNSKTGEDEVYCGVAPEHVSGPWHTATVPFDMFVSKFTEFCDHLAASHHHQAVAKD